jgi:cytochrome b6-f complex iron-sulfur subunit
MATIGELSGEEREQRAAELKRKMQEAAAKRTKGAEEHATPSPTKSEVAAVPVAAAAENQAPAAVAVVTQTEAPVEAESAGPMVSEPPVTANGNGAAAPVLAGPALRPAAPVPTTAVVSAEDPEQAARREMNRREFLMYSWGAALGLLTLQAGVATFLFLYPRFKVGEFGGKFFVPLSEVPPDDQAPNGKFTAGKFWLVTTAEGQPKALYMVCVHLGCLYKWVDSNHRFECPCHGSKYTHDGYYIEGPAARSLDSFETTVENGELVVDTGAKITGAPASESPFRSHPL